MAEDKVQGIVPSASVEPTMQLQREVRIITVKCVNLTRPKNKPGFKPVLNLHSAEVWTPQDRNDKLLLFNKDVVDFLSR